MGMFEKRLEKDLPRLVERNILSAEAAGRLREHYRDDRNRTNRNLLTAVLATLGSLLLGGGIILLLAHNWQDLSREIRAAMSIGLLVTGQGLGLWVLLRRMTGVAWREGVGLFWSLSVGACIALVSQTYHMPGSYDQFVLTWMLLILPVVYLLRATAPLVLYLVGTTSWVVNHSIWTGHTLGFWPLLLPVLPLVLVHLWRNRWGARATIETWVLVVCIFIGLCATLEDALDDLWAVVFAAFFTLMYLVDRIWFRGAPSAWQRPCGLGRLGILVVAFILTYPDAWEDLLGGGHYWRGWSDGVLKTVGELVLTVGLLVGWVLSLVRGRRAGVEWVWALFPAAVAVGYASCALTGESGPALMMNFYVAALGVMTFAKGLREQRLTHVNVGLLTLALLVILRFFHDWGGLVSRGVVFIVLGACFLATNLVMARKKGASNVQA